MQPCGSGYCHYPYNAHIHKEVFPIETTDSLPMQRSKEMFNSSEHFCHPNYMSGEERYKILKDYPDEVRYLASLWKNTMGYNTAFFSPRVQELLTKQQETAIHVTELLKKSEKDNISQFVDDHPTGSTIVIAIGTSILATTILILSGMNQ